MSTLASKRFQASGLFPRWAEVLDWFRHARCALSTPRNKIPELSDEALRDLGIRQTDIGKLVDRDRNWVLQASLTRARSRFID